MEPREPAAKPIYLDSNATTPIAPEVADAMEPMLRGYFGNPSSAHAYGLEAQDAVERARQQVASLLVSEPDEVVFTSGGTESNNMAIRGIAWARRDRGDHIITSSVEHPAVIEVCAYLEDRGFRVTYLPVDDTGRVSVDEVAQAVTPSTTLITIMHANNEVGSVEPIDEISSMARAEGIAMHTDAAQSVGKIPTHVGDLGVDLLSVAGHKLYAPKGIGALYLRRGTKIQKLMYGAAHETGRRPGTENVLEIVGLGRACEIAARDLGANTAHLQAMRDRLQAGIARALDGIKINGHPDERLPNTLSVSFRDVEANALLSGMPEIAASPGAACHSGEVKMSRVLEAMGVPEDYAMGTVRFSTGRDTTEEDIDQAVEIITSTVNRLRA